MIDNMRNYLPIGSVVRLREAKKCLMIFGVYQTHLEKDYDYIGVLWPEGNIGAQAQVLFAHEDIEEVVFAGYDTAERQEFLEKLSQYYESKQ